MAFESGALVDEMRTEPTKPWIGFGLRDKKWCALHKPVKYFEVSPVPDVETGGLRYKLVEDVHVVALAIAYMNEGGNIARQIQKCQKVDGHSGFLEIGRRKH